MADGLDKVSNANITYTYHTHTDTCYGTCHKMSTTECSTAGLVFFKRCPNCGLHTHQNKKTAKAITYSCGTVIKYVNSGNCEDCNTTIYASEPSHSCQAITCGKTEESIESATIVFN